MPDVTDIVELYTAIWNNNFAEVKRLLKLPAIRENAHADNNQALRLLASKGNFETFNELLTIDAVKENAHAKDNEALRLAAECSAHDHIRILLTIPNVRANAHAWQNQALHFAIEDNCPDIISTLLAIPSVRDTILANNNELFRVAVHSGDLEVVKALLAIPGVKENAHAENNEALYYAAEYDFRAILELLLKLPCVQNELISNNQNNIAVFLGKYPAFRTAIFENIIPYGIPLPQLFKEISEDKQISVLKDFLLHPMSYLSQHKISPTIIEAVRILYTTRKVAEYKRSLAKKERNRERFHDVDDAERISAIREHYHDVIKPHFQKTFEQHGKTDEERIFNIEASIREFLLKEIKHEAQIKAPDDQNAMEIIAFIETMHEDVRDCFLKGNDKVLMEKARKLFASTQSETQTAWRAYDPFAPVGGLWPNLLTKPLKDCNASVYTVEAVGVKKPTRQMASDLSREMMAYSYLLATDKQEGTEDERKLREATFIAKVAEIRRAHNEDLLDIDDPSCLPGTLSRAGDTWIAHSKSVLPNVEQLLIEELRSIVLMKFQAVPKEAKEKFYNALVMLSHYNAQDIVQNKVSFSEEAYLLRKRFKNSLGYGNRLKNGLNTALQARGARALSSVEIDIYLPALLANIGGSWVTPQLTEIYRKNHHEELENPYTFLMTSQMNAGLSQQQAILLLRQHLLSNDLLMKCSQYLANGQIESALHYLGENKVPNETLIAIKTAIEAASEKQQSKTKEKSTLWDKLYSLVSESEISDKGAALREIVNEVVDKEQNLYTLMSAYHLPIAAVKNNQGELPKKKRLKSECN